MDPRETRYRHILRRPRRPVWSVKTAALVGVLVTGVTGAVIYLLGKRSLFAETELTLAAVSGVLFLFLAVGLYRGVRVRRRDVARLEFRTVRPDSLDIGNPDLPDVSCPLDAFDGDDEGCLAALLAGLLWVLAIVVLLGLVWVLLNVGLWIGLAIAPALTWLLYRALRQVFIHRRQCQGNLLPSLGYAAFYTFLYTGWLFALAYLAHYLYGQRLTGT